MQTQEQMTDKSGNPLQILDPLNETAQSYVLQFYFQDKNPLNVIMDENPDGRSLESILKSNVLDAKVQQLIEKNRITENDSALFSELKERLYPLNPEGHFSSLDSRVEFSRKKDGKKINPNAQISNLFDYIADPKYDYYELGINVSYRSDGKNPIQKEIIDAIKNLSCTVYNAIKYILAKAWPVGSYKSTMPVDESVKPKSHQANESQLKKYSPDPNLTLELKQRLSGRMTTEEIVKAAQMISKIYPFIKVSADDSRKYLDECYKRKCHYTLNFDLAWQEGEEKYTCEFENYNVYSSMFKEDLSFKKIDLFSIKKQGMDFNIHHGIIEEVTLNGIKYEELDKDEDTKKVMDYGSKKDQEIRDYLSKKTPLLWELMHKVPIPEGREGNIPDLDQLLR